MFSVDSFSLVFNFLIKVPIIEVVANMNVIFEINHVRCRTSNIRNVRGGFTMKIQFKDESKQLDASNSVDDVIVEINNLLQEEYFFSHLIVDGVEVNEDPEAYLVQHLDKLKEIEVVAIPAKEFVNDLLLSAEDYVHRALPYIIDLAGGFAQGGHEERWSDLEDLLEGVQWISSMTATIEESIVRPTTWEQVTEQIEVLESSLPQFEQALVNQNQDEISTILGTTVQQVFEQLSEDITKIIDREGQRELLN